MNYEYNIGKYEVTAGQYSVFLNAVAKTDTYGLWVTDMWSEGHTYQIERIGGSGSYTYSVASGWANRPVTYVSWGDAARFANWLTNGQPTGSQGLGTTENGSYTLNGAMTVEELMSVTRSAGARYVIPTEDEWYKAAYHENDGVTGNYFNYPTGSYNAPIAESPPGGINSANFDVAVDDTTDVGPYTGSSSPYGTFDQAGNVWEWTEEPSDSLLSRAVRGGSYRDTFGRLHAAYRNHFDNPTGGWTNTGFRVAEVPEPATMSLLALGLSAIFVRRGRLVRNM